MALESSEQVTNIASSATDLSIISLIASSDFIATHLIREKGLGCVWAQLEADNYVQYPSLNLGYIGIFCWINFWVQICWFLGAHSSTWMTKSD